MAKGHQGKTALITGAASGLGFATARSLARDEDHAMRVWQAIDSIARADTTRRR